MNLQAERQYSLCELEELAAKHKLDLTTGRRHYLTEIGQLAPATPRGVAGQGNGVEWCWPAEHVEVFRVWLVRHAETPQPSRRELAHVPVSHFIMHGEPFVPLVQARRALRTWEPSASATIEASDECYRVARNVCLMRQLERFHPQLGEPLLPEQANVVESRAVLTRGATSWPVAFAPDDRVEPDERIADVEAWFDDPSLRQKDLRRNACVDLLTALGEITSELDSA